MCGISGIYHFDAKRLIDYNRLKKMTDIVRHRGPDGSGYYTNKAIGLGHRRLAIIDLRTGKQPMFNEDGSLVIVYNGEIYNYIELKSELGSLGHHFRTTSDTEIILKAYQQWGVECQCKFNGMWAFALWDNNKKSLFLSRDRIGEKPLHYAYWNNTLLFSSEIKSLFEYGLPKEPNLEFLEIYAVLKIIPAPYTFFKHINKLMPGHYIIANSAGYKEHKYWDLPDIDQNNMLINKDDIYSRFSYLLEHSIKIRMRSDVLFGAFLSGGLDSSSIVALMAESSNLPVKTFTIGYDDSEYDESVLAGLVASKFNTDHCLVKINPEGFDEKLERIVFHFDEPFGDSSAIPTGYISKIASEHVKMVLTGDGGDEVLSGYPSYQGIKFFQKYKAIPSIYQNMLIKGMYFASHLTSGSIRYRLNRYHNLLSTSTQDFNNRILNKRAKPNLALIKSLINPDILTWHVEEYISDFMKKCSYNDDFYKLMYLNFKLDLPNDYLAKVDRMSMAFSLETRLPFLDYRLIEFMMGVDKKIKMRGWERKSILKQTIAKKLPKQLWTAPKKGFRVPVREWFKNVALQAKLIQINSENGIFSSDVLSKIINDNTSGHHDHGNLLWSLMVLSKIF